MKKKVSRKWILPALGVLLACMIGGCGDGEAQETAAQDGVVSLEDTAQTEAADTAEDTGGADETAGNTQAQTEDIIIDEETKAELTTQLLEENELDTSIIENMVKTRGCTFTLPEGFTEVEDIPGMYVTKRYPIDASTIYYVEMDKDISMQLMTEETFLTQTQNNFEQIYGTDVGLDLKSYEKMEIDGYPAFRILCTYTVDDVEITQMEYVINADKSYVVTYSQTSEYDRMEEFEASAATIHLTF
ncbi:MAG: hypothetical protein NC321_01495 [Clostridium sp.]|nr:hypothetical protein [Clostridium sp.]